MEEECLQDGLFSGIGTLRHESSALRLLEEERRRLARDLHDEIGQILTAALFKIDLCLETVPSHSTALSSQLLDIRQTLTAASGSLRRQIKDLRPPVLHEVGLVAALRWLLQQFERHHSVVARLEAPAAFQLPSDLQVALYRITEEGLRNIAQHAEARTVLAKLATSSECVTFILQDDGKGVDPQRMRQPAKPGLGLLRMREYARQLGGEIVVDSAYPRGTAVRVVLPYLNRGGVDG